MKKTLKGFSLAELLIVMSIIAIIATLGLSISKQGIENAYNAYWYTGYQGIYDALSATKAEGIEILTINQPNVSLNADAINNIVDLLNVKPANRRVNEEGQQEITAPNGIKYTMWTNRTEVCAGYVVFIDMKVPQVKKSNVANTTSFIYIPHFDEGFLVPYTRVNTFMDLQNRKDLLPTYADDNISGKVRIDANGQASFQKRSFYSFREAFCRRYQNISLTMSTGTTIIDCSDYGEASSIEGIIKVENPKKVF